MSHPTHPIFCILPPYLLREIAEKGSDAQKKWALQTLNISEQFRGQRQAAAEITVLAKVTAVGSKQRVIYDAKNGSSLPGKKVRDEGEPPTGDPAVDEAYDGSGATFDLYKEVYGRNSIDDNGMRQKARCR